MRYAGGTVEPVDQVTLYLLGFNNTCRGYGLAGSADPRQLEEPSSSPSPDLFFAISRRLEVRRGCETVKKEKKGGREDEVDRVRWKTDDIPRMWSFFFSLSLFLFFSFLRCLWIVKIRVKFSFRWFFKKRISGSSKLIEGFWLNF